MVSIAHGQSVIMVMMPCIDCTCNDDVLTLMYITDSVHYVNIHYDKFYALLLVVWVRIRLAPIMPA